MSNIRFLENKVLFFAPIIINQTSVIETALQVNLLKIMDALDY